MNKFILYILLSIGLSFVSCLDDPSVWCDDGQKVPVSLTVSFSGDIESRDVSDKDQSLDYTTDPQCAMSSDDVYVLIFSVDNEGNADELLGLVQDLKLEHLFDNYSQKRLVGTIPTEVVGENIRLAVLANLNQNGIEIDATDVKEFLENKIGETAKTIYSTLKYQYEHTSPWKIIENGEVVRRIPLWGQTEKFKLPVEGSSLDCFLYRAIAKVNIWMNEKKGISSFRLNSITLNHANNGGYCVSSKTVNPDINKQYEEPDVPASVTPFTNAQKIVYTDFTEEQATKAFSDVIFLPEHVNTGVNATPVSLTVNYDYDGKTGLTKDIEFKDEEGNPFDVIRNHSYIFNIIKTHVDVDFTISVKPWEVDYMRGVPDQYTLTVDKSVITLKDYMDWGENKVYTLDVWTDYGYGWEIETDQEGNIVGVDNKAIDWLDISAASGNTNEKVQVKLNANKINTGLTKTAKFYVKAGNIRKEITVIMPQPPTANCYVVGDGQYEIIVSIKGNGIDGTKPEGVNIVPSGDASIIPHTLGIIWETQAGLISLYNHEDEKWYTGNNRVPYNKETSTLRYFVKSNNIGASIAGAPGGNALVGAFDKNGRVIWSWHIWVCPEMYDSNTHQIVEDVFLDTWAYTGYQVMDRNLGALTDMPLDLSTTPSISKTGVFTNQYGVAAMGLQYQWGRKDPFIGPAYSNDIFEDENPTGLLPVIHYYEEWGVNGDGTDKVENLTNLTVAANNAIDYAIMHPTQLIYWTDANGPTALVSSTIQGKEYGGYLWGTNQGLQMNIKELGTKTIYDPCPVGYRVPPVDAFIFYFTRGGNTRNSYDSNFRHNIVYIPHYATYFRWYSPNWIKNHDREYKDGEYQWGDHVFWDGFNESFTTCYDGEYIKDAYYYGFYLNIEKVSEPQLTNDKYPGTTRSGVYNEKLYYYKPKANQKITWLPLTGAYDPTKGFSFKDENDKTISIEQGSSISINSFLWTNSSEELDNKKVPAALALHGTEYTGEQGNQEYNVLYEKGQNGRHIHALNEDYVQVDRHYTSAVRCIKDTKKVNWESVNSLTSTASVTKGGETTITITSVNGSWKLIDPGKPWLLVTPDKGEADKGRGTTITLKASAEATGSTTIKFQIEGESTPRSCTVTVMN